MAFGLSAQPAAATTASTTIVKRVDERNFTDPHWFGVLAVRVHGYNQRLSLIGHRNGEDGAPPPSTLVGAFWRVSRRHPGDHRACLAAGRGARRSAGSRRLEDGDRSLGPERRAGVRAGEELRDGTIPVGGHPALAI